MYAKIKHDIQQEYYQSNYANDGQRFVAWYLRNIHGLDIIEAKDCITDGANDKQIDAVYINNQESTIYIIQGKFLSGESVNAEPVREVLSSWIMIQDLKALQDSANNKLKVKINEISRALEDDYEISLELITTSNLTESAMTDVEIFSKKIAENEELNANIVIIDNETLKFKYDEALNKTNSYINHEFTVDSDKIMQLELNDTKAVIAAISLKECVNIPGIKDGRLFRKNVRQSLGNSNKVNKSIAKTIKKEAKDFFFYHNGITALCSEIEINNNKIRVKDLNIVNGCQSLSTIFSCGEAAKKSNGYILFKFYEMSNSEKEDNITNNTNSQSAVKARDLRSNDKTVLAIKKNYEQRYPNGYLVTKRGEEVDTTKYDMNYVIDIVEIGKTFVSWYSQRPTLAYSETNIFDRYFNFLFKTDCDPEDIQALHELYNEIIKRWVPENPLGLNESLLAIKAYAAFHHLYTISVLFAEYNDMINMVPKPSMCLAHLKEYGMLDKVINLTGKTLNRAFKNAYSNYVENNKVFAPQTWMKNKSCIVAITDALRIRINSLEDDESSFGSELKKCCKIDKKYFTNRRSAD